MFLDSLGIGAENKRDGSCVCRSGLRCATLQLSSPKFKSEPLGSTEVPLTATGLNPVVPRQEAGKVGLFQRTASHLPGKRRGKVVMECANSQLQLTTFRLISLRFCSRNRNRSRRHCRSPTRRTPRKQTHVVSFVTAQVMPLPAWTAAHWLPMAPDPSR